MLSSQLESVWTRNGEFFSGFLIITLGKIESGPCLIEMTFGITGGWNDETE